MSTITSKTTILDEFFAIPDVHKPIDNKYLLDSIFGAIEERQPSIIVQGGDIANFEKLSRFISDPRRREDLPAVLADIRLFFHELRRIAPKSRIIFKAGNHDVRLYKTLMEKAPALVGMPELEMDAIFGLKAANVEFYGTDDRLIIDGLKITHGTKYSSSGPAYTAMAEMRNAESNLSGLSFHVHDFAKVYARDRFWMVGGFCGSMDPRAHGYLGDTVPAWKAGFTHGYRVQVDSREGGRFAGRETKWLLNNIESFGPKYSQFLLGDKIYG